MTTNKPWSEIESETFALVCLAIAEYDRRVRRNRALGGVMDLGGGWSSFIEDANKDKSTIYYEIAGVFEDLFPDYEGYDEGDWIETCFGLGGLWLKCITAAEV